MRKNLIVFSIIAGILIFLPVLFWAGVFGNNSSTPEGWTSYQNPELGFALWHPENMEARFLRELSQTTFYLEGSGDDETGLLSYDWISLNIQRLPTKESLTLEQVVESRSTNFEPATLAGMQGYRYETIDTEGMASSVILVSASANEFFEISYSIQDQGNQGYKEIVERILTSFQATWVLPVSPVVLIFGMILVLGVLASFGFLFLMKRQA